MKTKILFLIAAIGLMSLDGSAKMKQGKILSGDSRSEFGKYSIAISDSPLMIKDQDVTTYDLSYEHTREPIKIGVVHEKRSTVYLVHTENFEVQYACKKGVFGVQRIAKKYQQVPDEIMDAKLNRPAYLAQQVICQNNKPEEELLGLIACFFPALVNAEYMAGFIN